jgi:hypothetical protein
MDTLSVRKAKHDRRDATAIARRVLKEEGVDLSMPEEQK